MKGIKKFARGLFTGLMIGAISVLVFNPVDDRRRSRMRRSIGRAYKKLNGMVDDIMDMW